MRKFFAKILWIGLYPFQVFTNKQKKVAKSQAAFPTQEKKGIDEGEREEVIPSSNLEKSTEEDQQTVQVIPDFSKTCLVQESFNSSEQKETIKQQVEEPSPSPTFEKRDEKGPFPFISTVDNEQKTKDGKEKSNKKDEKEEVEEGLTFILEEKKGTLDQLYDAYYKIEHASLKAEEQEEVTVLLVGLEHLFAQLEALQKEIDALQEKDVVTALPFIERERLREVEQLSLCPNESVAALLDANTLYGEIVSKVADLTEKQDHLLGRLEEKKALAAKRDMEFRKFEKQADEAKNFEDSLYKCCIEIDILARDLKEKAEAQIKVTEKIKYKFDFTTKASAMLLTYMSLARKKKGPSSFGMRLLASILALKVGKELIAGKKEISYVKSYLDYSKEIASSLSSVKDLKSLLKKSLAEVQDLEEAFEKNFKAYIPFNKEYQKIFFSLQTVKENLQEQETFLMAQEKSLERSKEVTDEKVYQLNRK